MPEITGSPEAKQPARKLRWLWLLLVCVLVAAVLGGLKFVQVQQAIAFANSFPEQSESVTALLAQPVEWQHTYRTIGELRATQSLELRTEVDGKISAIGFAGGDTVKRGQLLLQLDSSEEEAQLRALRAQLNLAELELTRNAELLGKKLVSKSDYDIAVANRDVLSANAAALAATIAKKTLQAPFDAYTSLHTLEVGQFLAANSLVSTLTGASKNYWVDFKLPQDKLSVTEGDTVQVSGHGIRGGPLAALVISADARVASDSRSLGYRALLTDPPATLKAGSVVDVEVVTDVIAGVFRLPATAVRKTNFGASVYVLVDAEAGAAAPYRATRKEVTVGAVDGSDVIVVSGLRAGERVAAIGAFKLQDGMLANVVERAPEPAAAPGTDAATEPE
jgi:membrane fusion protein (multidrug efflux system)